MLDRLKQAICFLFQPLRRLGHWLDRALMGKPVAEQPPLIRNEILKLRAQSVDRLSTACFSLGAAGFAAPVLQPFVRQAGSARQIACTPAAHLDENLARTLTSAGMECGIPWTYHDLIIVWSTAIIWIFAGILLHVIGEAFLLRMGER